MQTFWRFIQIFLNKMTNENPLDRPRIFDPALKHLNDAIRLGDLQFKDIEIGQRWQNTRMEVIHSLLSIVSNSPWQDNLVLRGSLLLKSWLGDAARNPGDIDWVIRPKNMNIQDSSAKELFSGLIQMVLASPQMGTARIEVANIRVEDIWTYERANGRRIIFPWVAPGLPRGEIQMDLVFNEELFCDPIATLIPLFDGDNILVLAVNKEISLAWKILWLITDSYPQGKDLYDAVLLAEQTVLPFELLYRIIESSGEFDREHELAELFSTIESFDRYIFEGNTLDWDNFKLEYPQIEGNVLDWQNRLITALAPMFANRRS